MTEKGIKKLQEYENIIFLAEIGALIHDLGKLNDFFVKKHSIEGKKDSQFQDYNHGDVLEYDSGERHEYFSGDEILKDKAEKLKNLLQNISVKHADKSSDLYSFIRYHHCDENGNKCPNDFVRLLQASDAFDSEEDRSKASDNQLIHKTYYSNAFGYEKEIDANYNEERKNVYDSIFDILDIGDINKIKSNRREFLNNLKNSFGKALGMTARAANDVTLWEHSYMTASIMKALLCQSILENEFPVVKRKEKIESDKPFRIFSVGWNFFDFVSQSHTIPDVVGRIKLLEELRDEIKNLIEVEFLLGNCVYEDDYGLHFLVSAAFADKGIIEEKIFEIFNEKTNGVLISHLNLAGEGGKLAELLPKAIEELEDKIKEGRIDFVPKWTSEWKAGLSRKKLICRVCNKGFYCEGDEEEICETCKGIRNKGREDKSQQTRFIDEIAWNGKNYENVALVVLNFDLENWLNGKYVRSLFIDTKWKKGDNIRGLRGKIERELRGNFDWDEDAKGKIRKAIYELLRDYGAIKCGSLDEICGLAIEIIENRIKRGQSLRGILEEEKKTNILTKEILGNIEVLDKTTTPKNSSPSRLMRIWNNTKEFFEDLSTYVCDKSLSIDRYVLEIDKILGVDRRAWEVEISVKGQRGRGEVVFDGRYGITVTPHINEFIEGNKDAHLKIKVTDRDWGDAESEFSAKFKEKGSVRGYRTISVSPNMFMFLVPASKVFDCILAIKSRYMELFEKVYGKLPLNVGVVYFKRKTPFFVVLDSARRFMRCFKVPTDFLVKEIKEIERNKILIDVGEIELSCELGNGERDYYHPYIIVEEGGIALSDITVKHVLSLEKGDKIKIQPSFFDFEYLDTTARRFDIVLGVGKKRIHSIIGNNGPRPYLLEELDKFERFKKEIFEAIGSWTPIRDIESLAISKRQEWGEEGELGDKKNVYKELIDSALDNKIARFYDDKEYWKNNIKPFLLDSIMEGSFFDAIELFKSIMKMELKGGRE